MAFIRDKSSYSDGGDEAKNVHVISDELVLENKTGDILVLLVATHIADRTDVTVTTPTGFNLITTTRDSSPDHSMSMFWRRTTEDNETLPNIVLGTGFEECMAVVGVSIAGCHASNNPIGQVSSAPVDQKPAPNTINSVTLSGLTGITAGSVVLSAFTCDRQPITWASEPLYVKDRNATNGGSALLAYRQYLDGGDQDDVKVLFEDRTRTLRFQIEFKDASSTNPEIGCTTTADVLSPIDVTTITTSKDILGSLLFDSNNTGLGVDNTVITAEIASDTADDQVVVSDGTIDTSLDTVTCYIKSSTISELTVGKVYFMRVVSSTNISFIEQYKNNGDLEEPGDDKTDVISLTRPNSGTNTVEIVPLGLVEYSPNQQGTGIRYPNLKKSHDTHKNFVGGVFTFPSVVDFTDRSLAFQVTATVALGLASMQVVFVDEDNYWRSFNIGRFEGDQLKLIDPSLQTDGMISQKVDSSNILNTVEIDITKIKHVGILFKHANGREKFTLNFVKLSLARTPTIVGGKTNEPLTWDRVTNLLQQYQPQLATKASDLQYLFPMSMQLGNATRPFKFIDNLRSVTFSETANGSTSFDYHLPTSNILCKLGATDVLQFENSQFGSADEFEFEFDESHHENATFKANGTTFVNGTVTSHEDVSMEFMTFIGGQGIDCNDGVFSNCTFIDIDRKIGYVTISPNHKISDSKFVTNTASDFPLKLTGAGTYVLDNLVYDGFDYTLNATHTSDDVIIERKGGNNVVLDSDDWTDNNDGTFSNGDAKVEIKNVTTLKITKIVPGSRLRVFKQGTQEIVFSVDNCSATESQELTVDAVDIKIIKPEKKLFIIENQSTTSSNSVTAQQVDDELYVTAVVNFTFDGDSKRINCGSDVSSFSAAEVYSNWIRWINTGDNLKYDRAFDDSVGGEKLDGEIRVGGYFFITNDWLIKPREADHTLIVSGNLYPNPPEKGMFASTDGDFTVTIALRTSNLATIVAPTPPPTKAEIADAVWSEDVENSSSGAGKTLKEISTNAKIIPALL